MKLVATDLDGTLLDLKCNISPINVKAFKDLQERGIEVVPCTGRVLHHITDLLKDHDLSVNYIVSSNGAQVTTGSGDILFESLLDIYEAAKFLDYVHNNNFCYSIFTTDGIYSYNKNTERIKLDYTEAIKNDSSVTIEMLNDLVDLFNAEGKMSFDNFNDILNSNIKLLGVCAISLNKIKLQQGLKDLSILNNSYLSQTAYNNFQLVANGCNKGAALEFLSNKLGLTFQDIVAIGDNGNDLSMLEKAEISIAMGNAHDSIKDICTYTTTHHNESGFGHAINEFVLSNI